MPNIKSAKKRVLVTAKKNAENRNQATIVKTMIKKINALIDTNQVEEAEKKKCNGASPIFAKSNSEQRRRKCPCYGCTFLFFVIY